MNAQTSTETRALVESGRLRGFATGAREMDDEAVEVRGSPPHWLRGDLLLNGPALWELPDGAYVHWFDGLAMLHRVRIAGDGVRYRSRFLRSRDYVESTAARRPAYGGFGSPEPQGLVERLKHLRRPRVTDNGAVVLSRIGAQWIAQTETPFVTAFDADTLDTIGPVTFDDREELHLMSAHGITEADGTYWNVGAAFGPTCLYKVFRVAPGSTRREVLARIPVAKPGYLHALALTPEHVVLWEPAWRAQPLKFLFSGASYMDKFRWEPERGSRIHRVSRANGSVQSWDVPPVMAFHAVQAYEDGDTTVLELCASGPEVVPALRLQPLREGRPIGVPHAVLRYRLVRKQGKAEPERVVDGAELPVVHGSRWGKGKARFAWAAGLDPEGRSPVFDRTLKLDLDAGAIAGCWQREAGAIQLEPLMVDRPGSGDEEDGVLLVPTLADADEGTVIAVVDPASMACMATLHMPQVVPFGFHAGWNPAA
jgi:carotenoid cleavage dioxygenase-like enzyme